MFKRSFALLCILTASIACQRDTTAPSPVAVPAVTIVTFNVQNLFDTYDDPGKDDKAYLPIAAKQSAAHIAECNAIEVASWREECLSLDWNESILEHKLKALADAIRQIDGGPDIIAFQEVEKAALLDRLSTEFLPDLGYRPAILLEGQDLRGIDTGFLSRLPLIGEAQLHPLRFPDFPDREGDTRGILQATFELPDGSSLTGFAVHFPAPFHPTAMREAAYRQLADLRQALPDDQHAFAAGDFNTVSTEVDSTGILDRLARPYWQIAHELGCEGCNGSYYYAPDDNWSYLDMIFWSPARGENATWKIRANSLQVLNQTEAQRTVDGTPARFSPADRSGVSDHWPLAITIEPIEKQ